MSRGDAHEEEEWCICTGKKKANKMTTHTETVYTMQSKSKTNDETTTERQRRHSQSFTYHDHLPSHNGTNLRIDGCYRRGGGGGGGVRDSGGGGHGRGGISETFQCISEGGRSGGRGKGGNDNGGKTVVSGDVDGGNGLYSAVGR